jgi:hypothetical protein
MLTFTLTRDTRYCLTAHGVFFSRNQREYELSVARHMLFLNFQCIFQFSRVMRAVALYTENLFFIFFYFFPSTKREGEKKKTASESPPD